MPASKADAQEPEWVNGAHIAVRLDVREDQRNHADPFARIMGAISQVQDGQVFYLRNTFEPLPLYDVLGKRGFVAWARRLAADDWEIYFLKMGKGEAKTTEEVAPHEANPAASNNTGDIDTDTPVATISIDVRELTPPQPMMKILDALGNLKPGETLLVHHQRRPVHLYAKLAELGYTQKTIEGGPDQVDIYIRKARS